MIIHQLIARHLRHRDDEPFYRLQAQDAIAWVRQTGWEPSADRTVLDLGCGHGVFGEELMRLGCQVSFADERNWLLPGLAQAQFRQFNLDQEAIATLGAYDLVVCSNVFEHLSRPQEFLAGIGKVLHRGGLLYLSWTNWLSPWGGHEFSPFHYLGARRGHLLYDRLAKRPRVHTPFVNLFPTYIGQTLKMIRAQPDLQIVRMAPRYYTELAFLLRIPIAREFLAWNCALLIGKRNPSPQPL